MEISMIYLDHNATTPPHPRLIEGLPKMLQHFGNPSSIHWAGREPKSILRNARSSLAKILNISPLELVFNSGATEGNCTVIQGVAKLASPERNEFITSQLEHPSVAQSFLDLEVQGFKVHRIRVNRRGEFDWDHFAQVLTERTLLVSLMAANNETGILLPIEKVANIAKQFGAYVHTDAVQALGKIPVDLEKWRVDFASFSAHKLYALKGTGVLFVKKSVSLPSLLLGGGQERHRRGGTENVLGIAALGLVCEELQQQPEHSLHLQRLRDYLEKRVLKEIAGVEITHSLGERLPNTSSQVIKDVNGETLLMSLDLKGIAVSTGAACSSGSPEPSPILRAIGLSFEEAQCSLRISLGWQNTQKEVDIFIDELKKIVQRVRRMNQQEIHVSL